MTEAERIPRKHLCTLEPSISSDQTDEIAKHAIQPLRRIGALSEQLLGGALAFGWWIGVWERIGVWVAQRFQRCDWVRFHEKALAAEVSLPMPVQKILQLGAPLLRQKALPVVDPTAPEIEALVRDLADTLAHWRSTTGYGRGIAAPQLGILRRVIFLQLPGAEPWPLINPEIIGRSEETIVVWDACLSFLSIFMQVERHRQITVRYQNLNGETLDVEAGEDRDLSELLQHEIDHLEGILAIDRVVDVKTICTREEFEKRYRNASPYAAAPATIKS